MSAHRTNRQIHYWGAAISAIPVLLVIITGLLLMLKKQSEWIQPATHKTQSPSPTVSFDTILQQAKSVPKAKIQNWEDLKRIDVRPNKGIIKVQSENSNWELQLNPDTGEILKVAYRRSDIIESLHDGSFFGDLVKNGIFLPSAIVLLVLWVTGIYLFIRPQYKKMQRRNKAKQKNNP